MENRAKLLAVHCMAPFKTLIKVPASENTQENLRTPLPQIPPSTNYPEPFVISTQDAVNALN
jgi:hypothetical protein